MDAVEVDKAKEALQSKEAAVVSNGTRNSGATNITSESKHNGLLGERAKNGIASNVPNGVSAQEVSKQSYRLKVWSHLEQNDLVLFPKPCKGRIPHFKGAPEAADKLVELDAFKNAKTIKVNPDKPQDNVRLHVLQDGKSLLVPIPRLRAGLFKRVSPPIGSNSQVLKFASKQQGINVWGINVGLEEKVTIDLVVLGSVAVSKTGHRIGKGEGYADLEFAMMMKMGAVNQDTVVITTVHDDQVFNSLPREIFKEYDVPVDWIVTPTQVIEVKPRLSKPTGILWHHLTARRLEYIPILQAVREKEIAEGKDCMLKEDDSDSDERSVRPLRRYFYRGGYRRGFNRPRALSGGYENMRRRGDNDGRRGDNEGRRGDNEGSRGDHEDRFEERGDSEDIRRRISRQRKRQPIQPRIHANGNSERGGGDKGETGRDNERVNMRDRRYSKPKRPRLPIDFSVRVKGIGRQMRIRDLKAALELRGVRPKVITWPPFRGTSTLHFIKEGTTPETPVAVDDVVALLQGLKVTSTGEGTEPQSDGCFLIIEPVKPVTRIETVEATSV